MTRILIALGAALALMTAVFTRAAVADHWCAQNSHKCEDVQAYLGDASDGADGMDGMDGADGADGADGKDGMDYQSDEALALGAALSMPVWLQQNETGRISGGLGFGEGGETAVGATGVVRIDKNWAAFGGGAVSTQGGAWAGKAGVSYGW